MQIKTHDKCGRVIKDMQDKGARREREVDNEMQRREGGGASEEG